MSPEFVHRMQVPDYADRPAGHRLALEISSPDGERLMRLESDFQVDADLGVFHSAFLACVEAFAETAQAMSSRGEKD